MGISGDFLGDKYGFCPSPEERSFSLFNEVRSRGGFLELGTFLGALPAPTTLNLDTYQFISLLLGSLQILAS